MYMYSRGIAVLRDGYCIEIKTETDYDTSRSEGKEKKKEVCMLEDLMLS